MIRVKPNFRWISLLFFVLTACTTLKPEAPAESYSTNMVPLKTSLLSLPVELDVKDVEDLLNKQFQGLIYEDNSLEDNGGDNLMVKAWKQDNIRLNLDGNTLSYKVPLKLWIKAGWKIEKFGISLSDYREVNAAISLKFKSTLTLKSDWTITTVTHSDGYEWISKPVLKLGPVDVPVTFIADLILKTNQATLEKTIDKAVEENLDMKRYASEAWELVQNPVKINEEYDIWLRISPQEIYSTPLTGNAGKINYRLAFKSAAEAFVGKIPDKHETAPLPQLKISEKLDDAFLLNLQTEIPFPKATELANLYVSGQTYTSGRYSLTVHKVALYGSGGKLVIGLDVSGSIKGKIFLGGVPYYEPSTQSIRVRELDFDLKTRNALAKTGSWLLKGKINNMIEKNLVFPMSEYLESSRALLEGGIKDYQLADGIFLGGRMNSLDIDSISLVPGAIRAGIVMTGRLGMVVK